MSLKSIARAIASRGNLSQKVQEGHSPFFALKCRMGIFHHFLLKQGDIRIPPHVYGLVITDENALPTAHTSLRVNDRLFLSYGNGGSSAVLNTMRSGERSTLRLSDGSTKPIFSVPASSKTSGDISFSYRMKITPRCLASL